MQRRGGWRDCSQHAGGSSETIGPHPTRRYEIGSAARESMTVVHAVWVSDSAESGVGLWLRTSSGRRSKSVGESLPNLSPHLRFSAQPREKTSFLDIKILSYMVVVRFHCIEIECAA